MAEMKRWKVRLHCGFVSAEFDKHFVEEWEIEAYRGEDAIASATTKSKTDYIHGATVEPADEPEKDRAITSEALAKAGIPASAYCLPWTPEMEELSGRVVWLEEQMAFMKETVPSHGRRIRKLEEEKAEPEPNDWKLLGAVYRLFDAMEIGARPYSPAAAAIDRDVIPEIVRMRESKRLLEARVHWLEGHEDGP